MSSIGTTASTESTSGSSPATIAASGPPNEVTAVVMSMGSWVLIPDTRARISEMARTVIATFCAHTEHRDRRCAQILAARDHLRTHGADDDAVQCAVDGGSGGHRDPPHLGERDLRARTYPVFTARCMPLRQPCLSTPPVSKMVVLQPAFR